MPPKFQPTRGGARRRVVRDDNTHHLRKENTNFDGEIQEVGTVEPTPSYQTRFTTRQQAVNPQYNEGNDSSTDGSSSSSDSLDLDEGSGNEATSSSVEDTEPISGYIIKGKMLGIVGKVRIIGSELPEYSDIEAKYKFYGLGWMSEAPKWLVSTGLNGWTTLVLANTKERIVKSTLIFAAKFWWAVVWLRLFPIGGDNTLAEYRAVLAATLVLGFPLNMGAIIIEEINCRAMKLSTSLPFPCLITRLYREAHVPVLAGIDMETYATNKYDLEKSKDESRYDLKLQKPILYVFGPNGRTARATKSSTELAGEATGVELVF
ncbi:hypothetical protein HAX54_028932 [Datura stramonium]|uniref:Putative plant transposon protein domain-containing protein n=1 Tax=Datura stramonium TaxID=4076 RepID=A0ABS8V7B1_DATST|nr:hypothetical protein [Datura stramonium]